MKIKLLYLLSLISCTLTLHSQSTNHNMVHVYELMVAGYTDPSQVTGGLPNTDVKETIQYFDGLGRPLQVNDRRSSPAGKDMVSFHVYDALGRDCFNYLPFEADQTGGTFIDNPNASLTSFYNGSNGVAGTSFPMAPVYYEPSPLNRISKQGYPGTNGQLTSSHLVMFEYWTNVLNDAMLSCKHWKAEPSGSCVLAGEYPTGRLIVLKSIDENGSINLEFKDNQGKVILKRSILNGVNVNTYYVYNDLGRLCFVMPPEASAQISGSFNTQDALAKKYVYSYEYDKYGRMISKVIPGNGVEYMVYDKRNNLVLTQDANLRSQTVPQWHFIKYDALNRVIMTGLTKYGGNESQANMQIGFDNQGFTYEVPCHNDISNLYGYTNRVFSNLINFGNGEILTLNYYDKYTLFQMTGQTITEPTIYTETNLNFEPGPLNLRKAITTTGLLTCTKTRCSFCPSSNPWITSANYYDNYGRLIQTNSTNQKEGFDLNSNLYQGLTQNVVQQLYSHSSISNQTSYTYSDITNTTYDHRGRPISSQTGINSGLLAKANLSYNALGQLTQKNLYDNQALLQSLDYTYTVRGWLNSINNLSLIASPEEQVPDLFGMDFGYENSFQNLTSVPQYNGNISVVRWNTVAGSEGNAYSLHYDALNRLTDANYALGLQGSWDFTERYSEKLIEYDLNGNILSLERHGLIPPNKNEGIVDNLYNYYYNGNQLIGLNDLQPVPGEKDFKDNGSTDIPDPNVPLSWEYKYDENGNLKSDENKGIMDIAYNYLNLPEIIEFGNQDRIQYFYDANGTKRRKEVYTAGVLTSSTDYFGKVVYEDEQPAFAMFADGRAMIVPGETAYLEFHLKDHLGNVRVTLRKNAAGAPEVLQENAYYPFGLVIQDLSVSSTTTNDNKFKYNNKELQSDHGLEWYDYGARFYDPQLARWFNVDPLAEKYRRWSPYNYCVNNPMRFVDPDGMGVTPSDEKAKKVIENHFNSVFGEKLGDLFSQRMNRMNENSSYGDEKFMNKEEKKEYKKESKEIDKAIKELDEGQQEMANAYLTEISATDRKNVVNIVEEPFQTNCQKQNENKPITGDQDITVGNSPVRVEMESTQKVPSSVGGTCFIPIAAFGIVGNMKFTTLVIPGNGVISSENTPAIQSNISRAILGISVYPPITMDQIKP